MSSNRTWSLPLPVAPCAIASAPRLMRDLDQPLGDQRPRDRRAEQIDALVERVHAEHRKNEIAHEFFAQILDVDLLDAEHLGLLARRLELLALAEVGGERHHLAVIGRLQPFQDDRGVEPARIGEHDLFDVARHGKPSVSKSARDLREGEGRRKREATQEKKQRYVCGGRLFGGLAIAYIIRRAGDHLNSGLRMPRRFQ